MATLNLGVENLHVSHEYSMRPRVSATVQAIQLDDLAKSSPAPRGGARGYNPARDLPPELLTEIFDMCSPPGEDGFDGLLDSTTPEQEVERLAKKYLLQLSQVCSRWYGIVMCTPMLWSILIVDTVLWPSATPSTSVLMGLVSSSLERSCSHPLRIQVAADEPDGRRVLELLSLHAGRWRHFHLWTQLPSFQGLHAAKGNIPLLETLEISIQNEDWTVTELDNVFEVAPSLYEVTFTGLAGKVQSLPWDQLSDFKYINIVPNDLVDSLSLLRRFSSYTKCTLELATFDTAPIVDLPPIVSDVSELALSFAVEFDEVQPTDVLSPVLECLTFPSLDSLGLVGENGEPPLSWSQDQFLAFASRSGLHVTLTTLEIRATIRDYELLRCLAALPQLEYLTLSDSQDGAHACISDTLFTALIQRPDQTCHAPHLSFLCVTSLLQFTESVFWNFVHSRPASTYRDGFPLEVHIYWLPGRTRELTEEFLAHGLELVERGELTFSAGLDLE
ncbi:hypothetical protein DFH07DRAFT_947085 [Mycena maculata]|uniref:F-box domain-containing protein n=1 Tax=Mycena maculata TaxID=230809 RepID=A0AAD7HG45_9AGAR|nr:hypothetical protein DFH07DRAFT_947085 [Mycena maculata]